MADGLLNWYKGELEKEGKDVPATDDQLTYELGQNRGQVGAQGQANLLAKQYKK